MIKIGLMHWDANDGKLKERRAKRVALRVSTSSDYKTILENAERGGRVIGKIYIRKEKNMLCCTKMVRLLCFYLDLIRKLSVLKGTKRTC